MAQAKRKKRFFNVDIPIIHKETQAIAYELEELEGRYLKYDLTRILRGKSILLQTRIKIEGDKAVAYPTQIQLMPFYLVRMVRKGTNYVEDSFSAKSKDSSIQIKPFLVTRRKVSRAVRNALRKKCREELIAYIQDRTSEEIFQETLKNNLQKSLSFKLKKIYPLSLCEIKTLRIEPEKTISK